MELLRLIAAFFVALSFVLPTSASEEVLYVQESQEHVQMPKLSTSLPRKLKHNEDLTIKGTSADKDFMLHDKSIKPSSGTKQHEKEENVMHAAGKGTWKEWADEEGPKQSEYYFNMDYVWVRDRRPIHNKQIPSVP